MKKKPVHEVKEIWKDDSVKVDETFFNVMLRNFEFWMQSNYHTFVHKDDEETLRTWYENLSVKSFKDYNIAFLDFLDFWRCLEY